MSKITFATAFVTDTATGESQTDILVDGAIEGTIEKEVEDIGATSCEYVTAGYDAEVWVGADHGEPVAKSFSVRRMRRLSFGSGPRYVTTGEYETARKALAAAKAWARETLT